jgi:hypothetical protein
MIKKIKTYLRHNEATFPTVYRKFRAKLSGYDPTKDRAFLLSYISQGDVGAEIGVHRGELSAFFINNAKPSLLHLIDPWRWFGSEKYIDTLYGGQKGGQQSNMDARFSKVLKKFKHEIRNGQVQIHRMLSTEAAKFIENDSLDWIYIDGDHSYQGVMADLKNYYSKVKNGGYIIGDDYDRFNWYGDDVIRAVADFVKKYDVEEIEYKNIQFVLKKGNK